MVISLRTSLTQVVKEYNADENVNGILVQLPLPRHIDETKVLDAISIEKDVDGFHPTNIGLMALKNRSPLFISCTPQVTDHSNTSLWLHTSLGLLGVARPLWN